MAERITDALGVNEIDMVDDNTTYIGREDEIGNWHIVLRVTSGTVQSFRYATIANNPNQVDGFAGAWTDRASLNYDYYRIAF